MKAKREIIYILFGLFFAAVSAEANGQMKPFYRADQDNNDCELHIEEFCFARVCNGFI